MALSTANRLIHQSDASGEADPSRTGVLLQETFIRKTGYDNRLIGGSASEHGEQ
jgi:hypothetical protein